jgi:31-O-methyltransferase
MLSLGAVGLHREWRRLNHLGPAGFLVYHLLGPSLSGDPGFSPREALLRGGPGWRPIARHLRALFDLVLWVENWREAYASLRRGAPMPPLRLRGGATLWHGDPDQPLVVIREVLSERCYRRHVVEPERGVMLDIGANIGLVTLDWATRMPHVLIHAYEPDPTTFNTLRRNVEDNGLASRVRLYNEAVGAGTGTLTLYRSSGSVTTSAFLFDADGDQHAEDVSFWIRRGEPLSVPMVGFDEVMRRAKRDGAVELVKIDVEGAEADILEGAMPQALRAAAQFVVEYHDKLCERARARCAAALERAGFTWIVRESDLMTGLGLLYAARTPRRIPA